MRILFPIAVILLIGGCQTYEQLPPNKQQALVSKAGRTCQQFGNEPGTRAFEKCVQRAVLRYDQGVIDRWN